MIDENNGCITKSKLKITVKTLSKYNYRSRVAATQTTNILRDTETDKCLGRRHTKGRKIHTYKQAQKQTCCEHREVNKK